MNSTALYMYYLPQSPLQTCKFIQRQEVNISKGPCLFLQSILNTAARARPLCSKPTNVSHFIQCKIKNLCDGPEGPYIVQPLADSVLLPLIPPFQPRELQTDPLQLLGRRYGLGLGALCAGAPGVPGGGPL